MARLSVLQLDTSFPRIPGDVGCTETFQCELEIIRVPNATVDKIVTGKFNDVDLRPFQNAISQATGDLITTSCGFLAPAQSILAETCNVPFIASALDQLSELKRSFLPSELKILTFDSAKLSREHLPADCRMYEKSILGLSNDAHLRDVISNNLPTLNKSKASLDVCTAFKAGASENIKTVLLECTNLPPYKPDIRKICPIIIYDILTAIEAELPNSVRPQYL